MPRPLPAVLLSVSLLAASSDAANQVLVVDAGGGSPYTDLQSAVDAAGDGDVVLVRSGSYGTVVLDQKGLSLVGDPQGGSRPRLQRVVVKDLGASQRAVLRGLDAVMTQWFNLKSPGEFTGNDGAVLVEDCSFSFSLTVDASLAPPAVDVSGSTRHVMTRCTLRGLMGDEGFHDPASTALLALHSSVSLYGCTVLGGNGADAAGFVSLLPAQTGAPGIRMQSAFLLLSGGSVSGGQGGDGMLHSTIGCANPADGGPGIVQDGDLKLLSTAIAGGAPGADAGACGFPASPGDALVAQSGSLEDLNEASHALGSSSPARAGQPITLALTGAPTPIALLLVSTTADASYVGGAKGTLLVGAPFLALTLGGGIPASGQRTITTSTPALPAGLSGLDVFLQAAVPGAWGFGLLSSPSATAVLAAGF